MSRVSFFLNSIKTSLFLSAILVISFAFAKLAEFDREVFFMIGNNMIFTTQTCIILFLIVFISLLFLFAKLFARFYKHLFNIKIYLSVTRKSGFFRIFRLASSNGFDTAENILVQIKVLKTKKLYTQAIGLARNNYTSSQKILFFYLLLLLKLRKNRVFLQLFSEHPCGLAISLLERFVFKKISNLRKDFLLSRWFSRMPENQTIVYLYSHNLFLKADFETSQKILSNFMYEKKIFMTDPYVTYIMSRLAVKLEKKISGNTDFCTEYFQNINNYLSLTKKKITD